MKSLGLWKSALLILGAVGAVLPASILSAADRPASRTARTASTVSRLATVRVLDVELGRKGELTGSIVDGQGKAVARSKVLIRLGRKVVAQFATDSTGKFQVNGLRGGVYQIVHAEGVSVFRVWANGTAPKSARSNALIVVGKRLVRGQDGIGPLNFIQLGALAGTAAGITGVTLGIIGISEANEANDEADAANAKLDALLATLN